MGINRALKTRGSRKVLAVIGLVGLTVIAPLGPTTAVAQSDDARDRGGLASARECAALSSDVARLACYDALLGGGDSASDAAPQAPQGNARPSRAAESADAAPATGAERSAPAAPAPRSAGRSAEPLAVPATPPRGRPERPAPRAEPSAYPVTVVDVPRTRPEVVFVTEDGDVWVQTDGRRVRVPDVPFGAEIRPGALGSYFLAPDDGARAIRVRLQ